jgi:hypothetical protein
MMNKNFPEASIVPSGKQKSILDDPEKQISLARELSDVYDDRPELSDFVGAMAGTKFEADYSPEQIKLDEEYIEKTRQKIEEANSDYGRDKLDQRELGFMLSEMAQAMIADQINKNWFPDFQAMMTSDFDDLKVGIDAVLKNEEGGYLGAAFDFTVSSQDMVVHHKLDKEWNYNVVAGNVPTIKYFKDHKTGKKERLLVPKFIVGATKQDVEDMAQAYLNNDQEFLKEYPLRYLIIEQIKTQLATILDYYEKNTDNQRLSFAHKQYQRIETIINNLSDKIQLNQATNSLDYHEYSKKSPALQVMKSFRVAKEAKPL